MIMDKLRNLLFNNLPLVSYKKQRSSLRLLNFRLFHILMVRNFLTLWHTYKLTP